MKPKSAKAKGRRLQQFVARRIAEELDLPEEDVRSAIMGESGEDVKLSARARAAFPFAVECKAVERLRIWESLEQAEAHAEETELDALLVFRRNRGKAYAVLELDALLELLQVRQEFREYLARVQAIKARMKAKAAR